MASSTSRIFLGIKIECAQCHDHPKDNWKRTQFWEFAAFFSSLSREGSTGDNKSIKIPNVERVVQAKFLDGVQPDWQGNIGPRKKLADWMTVPNNPYFSRATANRLWGYFFGIGIVEPVDEFSDLNSPSHPQLLVELAEQFSLHGFDLKYLIKSIVLSETYQRSSKQTHEGQIDAHLFAKMLPRGLSPEQLFDSISEATGFDEVSRPLQDRKSTRLNSSHRT